jgi:hypothetical protein
MGFGCLVELCALDVWWSYGPWMFGGVCVITLFNIS